MLHCLRSGRAVARSQLHQLTLQVLRCGRDARPRARGAKRRCRLGRHLARQEQVQDAAHAPDVDRQRVGRPHIVHRPRHLGSRVLVRAAGRVQLGVGRHIQRLGVAKVAQLDSPLTAGELWPFGAHDVLWLDVPMADT